MHQPSASPAITLLVADHHELCRLGLRSFFTPTEFISLVGETTTGAAALSAVERLLPHVVLLELRLPDCSGIDLCRKICAASPDTRVIFWTFITDVDSVRTALLAGARGYLSKSQSGEALSHAIKHVAEGGTVLPPTIAANLHEALDVQAKPIHEHREGQLSQRQQRMLELLAAGKTNKEIAQDLCLSEKTVRNYLSSCFRSLGVSRRSQAAAVYTEWFPPRR